MSCAAVALGLALVAGLFAPIVRHEAKIAGARYGAQILGIESIRPTWLGVRLRGVDVGLADIPSAAFHVGEIVVKFGWDARNVEFRDAGVEAIGSRADVLREVDTWRLHHAQSASAGPRAGGAGGTTFVGLHVRWRNRAEAPDESLVASEVAVSRGGDGLTIDAGTASAELGGAKVLATQGHLELAQKEGHLRIHAITAGSLTADVSVRPKGPGPAPPPDSRAKVAMAVGAGHSAAGVIAVRSGLVELARILDGALEPGANVLIAGLRGKIRRDDDALNLGPGTLAVRRSGGRMVIELSPGGHDAAPREGDQALTFALSLPLQQGEEADREIVADVRGGPIWLSTLGVQDGDFGLIGVGSTSIETRSHVVLSSDGKRLTMDGEGKIHGLSLRSAALSEEAVMGLELAWRGRGDLELDGSRVRVDAGELDLGAIRIQASGVYERSPAGHRVRATFEIPLTECEAMLESTPKGLVSKLQGMRLAGSLMIKGKAAFDTANLDRDFSLGWDASNTCRVVEAPRAIGVEQFKKAFKHTVYTPEGQAIALELGPGTPSWVPYGAISKFMEVALLTTEDAGFHRHHGFDAEAIRNSIRENLKTRRFVRGASTLSMQLAKNLYLGREKNLARKLQEAVLTMYLEQELTKEQIVELYLNVVEFGPNLYGIGPAARTYFNTLPAELTIGQSLYLTSILPNPKAYHFGAGNAVTAAYMDRLHKLMEIANKRGHLTDEELEEGLHETLTRGSASPRRGPSDVEVRSGNEEVAPPPEESGEWLAP